MKIKSKSLLFCVMLTFVLVFASIILTSIVNNSEEFAYADCSVEERIVELTETKVDFTSSTISSGTKGWSWTTEGTVTAGGYDSTKNANKWTLAANATLTFSYVGDVIQYAGVYISISGGTEDQNTEMYSYICYDNNPSNKMWGDCNYVKPSLNSIELYDQKSTTGRVGFYLRNKGTSNSVIYVKYLSVTKHVNVYSFDLDPNWDDAPSGYTTKLYYIKEDGFYKDNACTNKVTVSNPITVPSGRPGYDFTGYRLGGDSPVIDGEGKPTGYLPNSVNYDYLDGEWTGKYYRITLDINGGRTNEDYDYYVPSIKEQYANQLVSINSYLQSNKSDSIYYSFAPPMAPESKPGYEFAGYYTQASGGEQIFNKNGNPTKEPGYSFIRHYETVGDSTLYAQYKQRPEVSITQPDVVYNGQAHSGYVTVTAPSDPDQYVIRYGTSADNCYSSTIPSQTNAGTYTYYYNVIFSQYSEYFDVSGSFTIKIAKATPTVTAPIAATGLQYTGNAQALILTAGTTSVGTIEYKVDNGAYTTNISSIVATTVGAHTVYYKVTGNSNYADVAANSFVVNIAELDKTALNDLITQANTYKDSISDYTDVASALNTAIETAQAASDEQNITAANIEAARVALVEAIDVAYAGVVDAKITAIAPVSYTTESKNKIDDARDSCFNT